MSLGSVSGLYTQFLGTTAGANKPFVTLLTAFVVASFTTFHDNDKSGDKIKAILDDQIQPTTFDYIVIGAGAAGSVVAARLSKHHSVLLLEAGGEINPFQLIPAMGFGALNQPNVDWKYRTVPQKASCLGMKNNQSLWSRGKGLGGSSNLNFMIYTRGSPLDFDKWADHTGDHSWSYENVTKIFKEFEFWDDPSYSGTKKYHGHNGKLRITYPPYEGMTNRMLNASHEAGNDILKDINLPFNSGFGRIPMNEAKNGERLTPFQVFIQPNRQLNRNLFINKFSQVTKILFHDKKKAYGVQYIRHDQKKEAKANIEIILSAGSVASPQILMLSGIGPKEHLKSLNIPVVLDQPALGKNLQEHVTTLLGPFLINKPLSFLAERDITAASTSEFLINGKGPLATTHALVSGYLVSEVAKIAGDIKWPDIQLLFADLAVPNRGAALFEHAFNFKDGIIKKYLSPSSAEGKDSFLVLVVLGRPKTRGKLLLKSNSINDDPLIDPDHYRHPADIKVMIEGIKSAIQIAENTTSFREIGAKLVSSPFPGCENQVYRSDAYWECFARHASIPLFHAVGTCSMGKRSSTDSVVDSKLSLIGVRGLRVIDASIMPTIPGTNTHAHAIMIGHMGSNFILSGRKGDFNSTIDLEPLNVPNKITNNPATSLLPIG